jgi:predicted transcriptional regulator
LINMISGRQIKAARALLGWTQEQTADAAVVSENAIARMERGQVDSRSSTVTSIEKALRSAGVEFLPAGGGRGEGVRLLKDDA